MKYIFAALVLISSVAHAQLSEYERKLTCGKTQFVISALTQNAQEKPIWAGADPQSGTQTMILQNNKTLTWTVVQYDQTMACVLQSGEGFRVLTEALKD
jgi:predicted secreted Zn-dependent protease